MNKKGLCSIFSSISLRSCRKPASSACCDRSAVFGLVSLRKRTVASPVDTKRGRILSDAVCCAWTCLGSVVRTRHKRRRIVPARAGPVTANHASADAKNNPLSFGQACVLGCAAGTALWHKYTFCSFLPTLHLPFFCGTSWVSIFGRLSPTSRAPLQEPLPFSC